MPQKLRELLYAWHPGRGTRWERFPGIEQVEPGGHAVLTFDDGPDQDATPAVLDALAAAGARATFFVLGSQVERYPDIGREIVAHGHELGLHGYAHLRLDRAEAEAGRDDIRRGFAVIEDQLGFSCRWFRPPYGKFSQPSFDACKELGMTPVYWSAWGLDWERVDAERVASVVDEQLSDGGIVLLHDSALHAPRDSAMPTALALPRIVSAAGARGIALLSLGEATTR